MRENPSLYEANARLWLRRLCEKYQKALTLADVPEKEWKRFQEKGFDLIWLMGLWQRSPGARQCALAEPGLREEYSRALPGWSEDDVAGSPYAVYDYSLDPVLGRGDDLRELKGRLNHMGLGLIVDFVPNHLAWDHPWTDQHPERFVQASAEDERKHPGWFFPRRKDGKIFLAHGRDPYFPPWKDTVQVNFFSSALREAWVHMLLQLSESADGVRCDMAMLGLNDIFMNNWGPVLKGTARPREEFWSSAIRQVKNHRPNFLFMAEVYWGLETRLQELGFDYAYDKILYDSLKDSKPEGIRHHLRENPHHARRFVHFIENHDEGRALAAFGRDRSLAAAVVIATLPGVRFFHDGQLEGRQAKLPVQLIREPAEKTDPEISRFYDRLFAVTKDPAFSDGEWRMLEVKEAWPGNGTFKNLLAWVWTHYRTLKCVVVNYSPHLSQGKVPFFLSEKVGDEIDITDELSGQTYARDPIELMGKGLYVELRPWKAHVFSIRL